MLHDLKHAYRMLMQSKGWTLVVLLSLAIGIGATTALFTAVNGLLLQTIPIRDPQSLVDPEVDRQEQHGPLVERLRLLAAAQRPERAQHVLERHLSAAEGRQPDDDRSDRRHLARVVQLRVGRQLGDRHRVRRVGQLLQGAGRVGGGRPHRSKSPTNSPAPNRSPSSATASGSAASPATPSIVGKTVRLNNTPVTIVGVLPPSLHRDSADGGDTRAMCSCRS